MRALDPRVVDAVWTAVAGLLPPPAVDEHPLGWPPPRIDDKTRFTGILIRLTLGCSWVDAGWLVGVGQATLRRRRDEWIAAEVFERLADEAIAAYDRIRGLGLSEVLSPSRESPRASGPANGSSTLSEPAALARLTDWLQRPDPVPYWRDLQVELGHRLV